MTYWLEGANHTFFIFATSSVFAQKSDAVIGKLVIYSDIDDTIKDSQVLDLFESMLRAEEIDLAFPGIAQLYRETIKANPKSEIVYVSTGPNWLMRYSHERFLNFNQFPVGDLYLPGWEDRKTFKYRTILADVEKRRPDFVILMGDNGEGDPFAYDQIAKALRQNGVRVFTFIRSTYTADEGGHPLFQDQQPYKSEEELRVFLNRIDALKSDYPIQTTCSLLFTSL